MRHRSIERRAVFRVLGAELPHVLAVQILKCVPASLDAVQQMAPSLPIIGTSGDFRPRPDRRRGVRTQTLTHGSERKLSGVVFPENTHCSERAQQPVQRIRMALCQRREFAGRTSPVIEMVSDPQG